ncbi:TPA: HlyD family secretion protein [Candidatus Gastranaerophilales bacterium HUM_13]|nr:HlyD family secretion protein [bacterium]CCZ51601.1 secretion protein HlyD family protein [Acinetobacter sp. CAG:196]DAB07603.1 MAG TPA: HlyD family secretion protein [Candidatus Gastranaerophilales bacterium HUM_15]DAB07781.1 MAG TPA: HlyD family secretion protein [Candidatus Gastranaerophilales bacterium HUM_13]DAB10499.1 MAG TPA: HlyD family secretion protein [Candidatus Gastranaerophilales bacterium HUM_16]DAB22525.1 MAG TPA: HlyD family secretion protein [Candidatus Gastranaerophilales
MSEENKIEEENTKKLPVKKRYIFTSLAIIGALAAGYFIYDALGYQSTDDAYVETTTVSVSPKVSGQIVKVLVKDNQPVKAGQVVAVIDKIDYQVKLDQATAAYEKALLNQQNAHANLNAANSEIALAQKDLERYENLYQAGAVSKQTLDRARTNLESVQAKQTTAEQSIFSKDPSKSAKVADADLNVLKAQKRAAELALEYTDIKAPIDGTVSNKKVEVGMMVQPGSPLFVVVPHDVWVVANYKETQLTHMKKGMDVDIKIDTYPDKVFKGKIDSIQRSSGAKASLFPPENAVGSFVKIVQRIPVKIVFTEKIDPEEYAIIPGMSVVPKVKIRDFKEQ